MSSSARTLLPSSPSPPGQQSPSPLWSPSGPFHVHDGGQANSDGDLASSMDSSRGPMGVMLPAPGDPSEDCPTVITVRKEVSSSDCLAGSDQQQVAHLTNSDQSVVCRICHLSASESNMPLEETGCECRGALRFCHRRCVEHWMLVKMSKQCEICQHPFQYDIVIPEFHPQEQSDINNDFRNALPQQSYCQDSRRFLFFIIYVLLLFTAATSTALSFFTREEYLKRRPVNETTPAIEAAARSERMYAYGVSIAVTIFIGFHMIAVGILWIIAEMVVLPKERLLKLHIMMFRAIYTAQLREASHEWMRQEGESGGQGTPAAAAVSGEDQQQPSSIAGGAASAPRPERISVQNFRTGLQRLVAGSGRRRRVERGRVQEVFGGQPGSGLALPRYHNMVTHVLMPPNRHHHQEDESNFGGGEGGQEQVHVVYVPNATEQDHRDVASRSVNVHALNPTQAKDENLMLADHPNTTTAAEMGSQQTGISEVHLHVTRRTSSGQEDRQPTGTPQNVGLQDPTGMQSRSSEEPTAGKNNVHIVINARISE